MRAHREAQGVACITPGVVSRRAVRVGCSLALGLAALGLSACGSGGGDTAADTATAAAASAAQQTVGADLLPPDASIAGTAAVSTALPDEDLSPANAGSASAADLLPPA
jgi:hypothetical protein